MSLIVKGGRLKGDINSLIQSWYSGSVGVSYSEAETAENCPKYMYLIHRDFDCRVRERKNEPEKKRKTDGYQGNRFSLSPFDTKYW